MQQIFVTRQIPEQGLALLRDAFGEKAVTVAPQEGVIERDALLESVAGATALLPILTDPIDAAVLDAAGPQLKVIANYAVGYNNIDVAEAARRGIVVTNTPGVLTETTADLSWALLMAAARRLGESDRLVRAGAWESWGPMLLLGQDIYGATLGIYGLGRIGRAVARRARAFNMPIIYHNRNRLAPEEETELGLRYVDKATLLREADFLSIHCPLTAETRHAFGPAEFEAMKKSAVLINTARGPVVDEAALVDALQEGNIFAAGLDVFEEEPAVHPGLLRCERALLAPHIGSASEATRARMAAMAAENIIAVLRGEAPKNPVHPAGG